MVDLLSFPNPHPPTVLPYKEEQAAQLESCFQFWEKLAQFDAGDTGKALSFLMNYFQKNLGGKHVSWLGGVKVMDGERAANDLQAGWRVLAVTQQKPSESRERYTKRAVTRQNRGDAAMTSIAFAKEAGTLRAVRLRDLVDYEEFKASYDYEDYMGIGVADRIFLAAPAGGSTESILLIDRGPDHPLFTKRECEMALMLWRGIPWFHRQAMLHHGIRAGADPLTDRERQILSLLLTDAIEKEIADVCNLAITTTRNYISGIYRKLNVRGRAGLMSLWLSGGGR